MQEKVDSNNVGAFIAEEESLKVLPALPIWHELEPNSYSTFGADYKTVARTPIKKGRQRKKGVLVDMDATGAFDMDVTDSLTRRLMQGFLFANARQKTSTAPLNGTAIVLTAAASVDKSVSAASGLGVFVVGQIVLLSGFTNPANNGMRTIATVAATKLTFVEAMINETPTAVASVEVAGRVGAAGDLKLAATATEVTLTSTVLDFTTLGLTVGESIFIGGDTAATQFALNLPGFARIQSVAAHAIVFDDTTFVPVTDAGATKTIHLFFGSALRNETADNLLVRKTYCLERQLGSDVAGTQAEYLKGCVANDLTINLAEAAKIDANLSFIALDHETRTTAEGVEAGTRITAPIEDAYNTTSNLYRSKLYIADGLNADPLFAYASELKLSIKNGVKPLKALSVLGGFEASAGTFEVSATMEAYFSEVVAIGAIRDNADVGLSVIATKANKGFAMDMPLTSLGGGQLKIEKDNPVKLSLTIEAAECTAGYTLFMTFFPYLPNIAMASNN